MRARARRLAALVAAALCAAATADAQAIQALNLFEQRCASCHSEPSADSRAPSRESLRQRTPEEVFEALTNGSMKTTAEGMTDAQKRLLAEGLTGRPMGAALPGSGAGGGCSYQ